MPQEITSYNVGCAADGVQISDEVYELSGDESWTATCEGKTYDCTHFPDADSSCYERHEKKTK